MNFHILTLFPEMVEQGLNTSILKRAREAPLIGVHAVNIRDYTLNKHGKTDDYPYGGGAGMLMQAQPVYDAYQAVIKKLGTSQGQKTRVVYLTPQGKTFTQKMAQDFSREENLIFLCGHYEGIDERVLEEIVTDEVSIGDYVLTGGELAAMVMIDAIARLAPGVLNNEESARTESFHKDLLEYPQYSRPETWRGREVPKILLSGDHKKIEAWRLEQSILRTEKKRPDLYGKYLETQALIEELSENKLIHMDMIELLRRGEAEFLVKDGEGVLLSPKGTEIAMLYCRNEAAGRRILETFARKDPGTVRNFVAHQTFMFPVLREETGWEEEIVCRQAVYTRGVTLPVGKGLEIRKLTEEYAEFVGNHYDLAGDLCYVRQRIRAGVMYGAFVDGLPAGFIGEHEEGSIGMLEVLPAYRRKGIGAALEAFYVNKMLAEGRIPFGQIIKGNDASMKLQEKLGFRISRDTLCWFSKK